MSENNAPATAMKTLTLLALLLFPATLVTAVAATESPETKPELPGTGLNVARTGGGWLNLVFENHQLVVTFYDANKAPARVDVDHGLVRFRYVAREEDRFPLTRGADGMRLVSPPRVRGPHVFIVHLSLHVAGSGAGVEHYTFRYPANSTDVALTSP